MNHSEHYIKRLFPRGTVLAALTCFFLAGPIAHAEERVVVEPSRGSLMSGGNGDSAGGGARTCSQAGAGCGQYTESQPAPNSGQDEPKLVEERFYAEEFASSKSFSIPADAKRVEIDSFVGVRGRDLGGDLGNLIFAYDFFSDGPTCSSPEMSVTYFFQSPNLVERSSARLLNGRPDFRIVQLCVVNLHPSASTAIYSAEPGGRFLDMNEWFSPTDRIMDVANPTEPELEKLLDGQQPLASREIVPGSGNETFRGDGKLDIRSTMFWAWRRTQGWSRNGEYASSRGPSDGVNRPEAARFMFTNSFRRAIDGRFPATCIKHPFYPEETWVGKSLVAESRKEVNVSSLDEARAPEERTSKSNGVERSKPFFDFRDETGRMRPGTFADAPFRLAASRSAASRDQPAHPFYNSESSCADYIISNGTNRDDRRAWYLAFSQLRSDWVSEQVRFDLLHEPNGYSDIRLRMVPLHRIRIYK